MTGHILPYPIWTCWSLFYLAQCPRKDLNKRFLPRPKTITAWKLIPHRSKISKNWNPPHWVPLHRFFKNRFSLMQKQLYIEYIQTHFTYYLKKFPPCRILIHTDIRWGISFHAVIVFDLGKDLLFKSVLGRCAQTKIFVKVKMLANFFSPSYGCR